MDVYIKPKQKINMVGRRIVYVKDLADVYSLDEGVESIKNIPVLNITADGRKNYAVSVMDIIRSITASFPKLTVNNVGEKDVLVEFLPSKPKELKPLRYLKILLVCIVLFIGSGTAIMGFQADSELPVIFDGYYSMLYGKTEHSPYILEIPYSVGIAFGILLFFNHFSRSKETKDPTPIEIQMTLYEQQTVTSMVDSIENEKGS